MSTDGTRTTGNAKTFEDRLLEELQREIALRAEDPVLEPQPVIRRRITARRALVALAACVVAAGATVVALPASTGGAQAYAIEQHEDGSVTVSVDDIEKWEFQGELAERLRELGIFVSVDRPRSGYVCAQPRGESSPPGTVVRADEVWKYTLRPGDTLVFEEPESVKGGVSPAGSMYMVKGRIKPCREVPWEGPEVFEKSLKSK
ncbi:hypothetical protein ACFZAE_15365 [Streptomyces scabiei]|uniref:hypothetical protein n=1 Tax=Streptomyces TaxID=1883 RepID=UPI001C26F6E6|nr:hypothetical protein [Streptomyces sp. AC495_CC817]